MNADCLVQIEQVSGEGKEPDLPGAIRIDGWSWGATCRDVAGTAAVKVPGEVLALGFSYRLDNSTAALMSRCVSGAVIPKVVLMNRRAGGARGAQTYLRISLSRVRIASVDLSFAAAGELPLVRVSLAFGEADLEYVPQHDTGGARGGPARFRWQSRALA